MHISKPLIILKRLGIIVAALFLLGIVACLVLDQFVQFRMSDEELTEFFQKENTPATIRYYQSHGRTLRYVSIGDTSKPALLFIHGSPSSLSIYKAYYKDSLFLNTFHMLAVDRPGYGNSGLGRPEGSIIRQAAMIKPILDSLHHAERPVMIMAGSYGTSIACRIAMDFPHLVDGMVLVAPSLAPGRETVFWITPIVELPLFNWFIPRMLRTANTEKLAHRKELEKMLPYWQNVKIPIVYIQGQKDEIIDTSNATFARRQLKAVPYLEINMLKNRKHFLAYVAQPLIRRKILELHERLQRIIGVKQETE